MALGIGGFLSLVESFSVPALVASRAEGITGLIGFLDGLDSSRTPDMVFDDAYQIVGFVSALMFPLATGAQTYKVIVTRSAADVSYGWQVIYLVAEILYVIYAWHFKLWVILGPTALELVMMVAMIAIKAYLEIYYPKLQARRARRASIP